jgi:DNA-binding NtrC family response regulator
MSSFTNIISKSAVIQHVFDLVEKLSHCNATVLIHGESKTDKEITAKARYFNSN